MKYKILGILMVSLVFMAFNIVPIIQGSEIHQIMNYRNEDYLDFKSFNLIDFLEKINDQGKTNEDNVFIELQKYSSNNNFKLSSLLFVSICNRIKRNFGEEGYNEFMIFFEKLLRYSNSNNLTLQNIYRSFHINLKQIQKQIQLFNNGLKTDLEYSGFLKDLLDITKPDIRSQEASTFEAYWEKYGQAKCYWDGYMPSLNSPEPNKARNVYERLGIWRGDNYYDWSENAAKYILGTEDSPQASFYILNVFGVGISALVISIGLPLFLMGLFSGGNDSIGKLTLGGGLSLIGVIIVSGLLWYDWNVLNYFLFGTNAYLECLRFGNVDFMVHVINETGYDINTSCTVIARSTEAFDKENQPVYPGFYDVNWSTDEFEYSLEKVANYNANEHSIFSLHSAQESPEKWKKAVPPPGIWSFTVNAGGYQEEVFTLTEEIGPGECFNITIQLKKE